MPYISNVYENSSLRALLYPKGQSRVPPFALHLLAGCHWLTVFGDPPPVSVPLYMLVQRCFSATMIASGAGGPVPQRAVRSHRVVVFPPTLDQHLGFPQRVRFHFSA
jgi:hypothetical protein